MLLKAGFLDPPAGGWLLYEAVSGWSLVTVRCDKTTDMI